MRKAFDVAELLLCVVFSIFYYISFDICDNLQLGEILETVISLVVGTVGNMALAKVIRRQFFKRKWICISVVVAVLLAEELFLRLVLHKSVLLLAAEDLLIWGVLPMAGLYLAHKYLVARSKKKILAQHGDGSEGLRLETSVVAEEITKLQGENKPIDGVYDKSCAIKCTNGVFVGKKDKGILALKGIPYAQQPIGPRRWQRPEPLPKDAKIYEAYYYGHQEPQPQSILVPSSYYLQGEDCLHLNIWINTKYKEQKLRPVIVFFPFIDNVFGGTANPNFDGDSFVKEHPETIFVNVDYRFGFFGNLELSSLPGGEAYPDSGNLGILDQIAALEWLKANLEAMGGDPQNITVLGSVTALLLPVISKAKGLFKRVISIDGSIFYSLSLACAQKKGLEVATYFKAQSMEELLKVSSEQLWQQAKDHYAEVICLPVRDGKLIPEKLLEAYEAGAAADIELLLGNELDAYNVFVASRGEAGAEKLLEEAADIYDELSPRQQQCLAEFKERYCSNLSRKILSVTKQYTYTFLHMPNVLLSKKQATSGGRVQCFLWSVASPVEGFGAYHGAVMAYLLGKLKNYERYGLAGDPLISQVWQQMVVNFMKTGDPSIALGQVKHVNPIAWPCFDNEGKQIMIMTEKQFALDKGEFVEQAESLEPLAEILLHY